MNVSDVSSRDVGAYPLSIATSLALEGAMGIHPDPARNTGKAVLQDYEVVWVNLKTIFRNLYQSINREVVLRVSPRDLASAMLFELEQFDRIVADLTGDRLKVQYYLSDYAGLELKYRYAKIRGYVTDLQRAYGRALVETIRIVLPQIRERTKLYRLKVTDEENRKALVFTSYAYDLLARHFSKIFLLESHTGSVKNKLQFYTKYINGKELAQIPFCEGLMQVFGDSELFFPMSHGVRKQVLEVAEKYNWSQVTTHDKIVYGIKQIKDHLLRDRLIAVMATS